MSFVAWQMLTGDRAKYLGLIFAIAFSTFLMSHQTSIFAGLMDRTTSQIKDVRDARIWVMDGQTQYVDEVKALTDQDLFRIRGVAGVEWAVPLYKGLSRAKAPDGKFRAVILMGLTTPRWPAPRATWRWARWTACVIPIPSSSTGSAFTSSSLGKRSNWGRRWR